MSARRHLCAIPGCTGTRKRWQRLCASCFAATPPAIRTPLLGAWADKRMADYRHWLREAATFLANRHALATTAAKVSSAFDAIARLTGDRDHELRRMMREPTPTLTIDEPDDGGSEPGAWVEAIALTPTLTAIDLDGFTDQQELDRND